MVVGTLKISLDRHFFFLQRSLLNAVSLMPACKSKFVSGSRKATVAKAVFLG